MNFIACVRKWLNTGNIALNELINSSKTTITNKIDTHQNYITDKMNNLMVSTTGVGTTVTTQSTTVHDGNGAYIVKFVAPVSGLYKLNCKMVKTSDSNLSRTVYFHKINSCPILYIKSIKNDSNAGGTASFSPEYMYLDGESAVLNATVGALSFMTYNMVAESKARGTLLTSLSLSFVDSNNYTNSTTVDFLAKAGEMVVLNLSFDTTNAKTSTYSITSTVTYGNS